LNDRGLGKAYTTTLTDNLTRVFMIPSGSSGLTLVVADRNDNKTKTQAITHTKSTTTALTLGTASTVDTATDNGSAAAVFAVRDVVAHNDMVYVLSKQDNGTLFEDGTSKATNIFPGLNAIRRIVLSSDGTNLIGIADNGTVGIDVFNLTTAASPARVGGTSITDNVTGGILGGQFCGAVGGGRVLIANDNVSKDGSLAAHAHAAHVYLNSTAYDNTTGWEITTTINARLDNSSSGVHCAMAYAGQSGDNRTFYLAIDNDTGMVGTAKTLLYKIVDNSTSIITKDLVGSIPLSQPESLALAIGASGIPFLAVDNNSTGTTLYKDNTSGGTTTMITLVEGLGIFGMTNHGDWSTKYPVNATGIGLAVSADNKTVGIVGASARYGTNMEVRIWYDE
jgi:hypothetical protein